MLERNTAAHDMKCQQNSPQFRGVSGSDLASEMTNVPLGSPEVSFRYDPAVCGRGRR